MTLNSVHMSDLPKILSESADNNCWTMITSNLGDATRMLNLDEHSRDKVTSEVLDGIAYVLKTATSSLCDSASTDVVAAVSECFRFLRNACAIESHVQKDLVSTSLFNDTSHLLDILCNTGKLDNDLLTCTKIVIQFIGNAVVGNRNNQRIVWSIIHSHMSQLLSSSDHSLANCTCMVLYNFLLGELDASWNYAIANTTLLLTCYSEGSEFAMFAVELIIGKVGVLEEIYLKLKTEHRLKLLDAIWSLLMHDKKQTEVNVNIPLSSMFFLVDQLKLNADCVLSIVEDSMTAEPRETLRLLDVIACASSHTQYHVAFQADRSLLISVGYLLKNVTEIGKAEGGNVFSSVQRLSEMKLSGTSVEEHPLFGFKAALVRLLGNLCHRHVDNQNQVRELGCIPAVLDTCNIDVYNPLLLQWGVLAVRNLLENNIANQQVIAGLVAHGPAPATVLHELGMEMHQDENGSLCIAPLKRS